MSNDFSMLTISRHRMKTDGKGITSLIALAGCPLSCPYCINGELLKDSSILKRISPKQLVDELAIDHCYFLYTGGGATFGGGEPLLQTDAILEFAKLCPSEWNINIETSLNVPFKQLEPLLTGRFSFIIDIKAMQADIYKQYTGRDNTQVIHNLTEVSKRVDKEKYIVKVPLIPEYSDEKSVEESVEKLKQIGVEPTNILTFTYQKIISPNSF